MRVLVGTPCGGGMVTTPYLTSMMDTVHKSEAHKQNVARQIIMQIPNFNKENPEHQVILAQNLNLHAFDIGLWTLAGESLVQRGRNHLAQVCLVQGWEKLMFIDADAGWTWEQLHKIISSPHPIIAGICPLKVYPISLNYLPFQEDEQFFTNAQRNVESTKKMVEHHKSPIIKVPFVGTAFMCIHRNVLMKLAEIADHYIYPNSQTGQTESHWDFFKVQSVSDTYLSEDWGFCDFARKNGFDVHIDTDVIISHTGQHCFRAT